MFLQNYQALLFSELTELFSCRKLYGKGPRCGGPSPQHQSMGPQTHRSMRAVDQWMNGQDLIGEGVLGRFNLDRRSTNGRPGAHLKHQCHGCWWLRGASMTYKAWYSMMSFSTRSIPRGDNTLLTCNSENESRKAGSDGADWMTFNGGGASFQRRSCSKVCSDGGGAGGAAPPSDVSMWEALARWITGGG
jgi:hypothetical protein